MVRYFDLLSELVNYLWNTVFSGAPLQLLCHLELNLGLALTSKYHRHKFMNKFRVKLQLDVNANLKINLMLSHCKKKKQYCCGLVSILILLFTTDIVLNPMLKILYLHICFSFFELTFHLLSAYYSSRAKLNCYFILPFLFRELKMSCEIVNTCGWTPQMFLDLRPKNS